MKNILVATALIFSALIFTLMSYAQNKTEMNCKIWKPKTFCEIHDSIYLADRVFGIQAEWKEETCVELDMVKNLTGVWLTFTNKKNCKLFLKSNFENFKLIKKSNGQKINLSALYSKKGFITSIKAKKFTFTLKKGRIINIIMLFPEAEKGDKIIIDDFIEAEIQ